MAYQELERLGNELSENGHAKTSFDLLEIVDFRRLANNLSDVVSRNSQLQPERIVSRIGMIMCKDPESKAAGSRVMQPVVEALFPGSLASMTKWDMYTVNQYEVGHFFSPHQDYLDGTVIIVTTTGVRRIDIYKKEEDDVFNEVTASHEVHEGEILLLNGYRDLGHSAQCIVGPSISVVGDVSRSLPSIEVINELGTNK